MRTTNLQIPISKSLKTDAVKVAKSMGFSSLQEIIRVMIKKLANEELAVNITEQFPPVQLSEKAIKRYEKMDEDFKKGRNIKSFTSVGELMDDLMS